MQCFIVAIVVTIYEIVAEKQIAIEFARKELVGTRYLDTLRNTYATVLTEGQPIVGRTVTSPDGTARGAVLSRGRRQQRF